MQTVSTRSILVVNKSILIRTNTIVAELQSNKPIIQEATLPFPSLWMCVQDWPLEDLKGEGRKRERCIYNRGKYVRCARCTGSLAAGAAARRGRRRRREGRRGVGRRRRRSRGPRQRRSNRGGGGLRRHLLPGPPSPPVGRAAVGWERDRTMRRFLK